MSGFNSKIKCPEAAPRASATNASAEVADDNEVADVESNPDFSFPGPVAADGSGWIGQFRPGASFS